MKLKTGLVIPSDNALQTSVAGNIRPSHVWDQGIWDQDQDQDHIRARLGQRPN